jgi:uncharacterized membrane protein (DUF373 family)
VGSPESLPHTNRAWVARGFTAVEDLVYLGLALMLAGSSITLLATGLIGFWHSLTAGSVAKDIVDLLDRSLLILLLVELLYTVQVSFREHTLVPEPFLLVGLIAGIRRVLVLTATFSELPVKSDIVFQHLIIEMGGLTVLIIILVLSLYLLRKQGVKAVASRAT